MKKLNFIIILLLFPVFVYSSNPTTIPSWHYAYRLVKQLQIRGLLRELSELNKPYTWNEVLVSMEKVKNQADSGKTVINKYELKIINLLEKECKRELGIEDKDGKETLLLVGINAKGDLDRPAEGDAGFKGILRSRIIVPVSENISIVNSIVFDQYKVDDPDYVGKKWRSMIGYTEQAYAAYEKGKFRLKFGRDFLRWGAGINTLFFSDVSRPLDHFAGSFEKGPFKYTFVTGFLDEINVNTESVSGKAQRYIAAHRIDSKWLGGRLQISVSARCRYLWPP